MRAVVDTDVLVSAAIQLVGRVSWILDRFRDGSYTLITSAEVLAVVRARLPAALADAGLVYADREAPWWPAFEAVCLGFPNTAYVDQVDAFSLVTQIAGDVAREASQRPAQLVWRRGRHRSPPPPRTRPRWGSWNRPQQGSSHRPSKR